MQSPEGFEWDEAKRLANIEKHRFDFLRVTQIFDGRPVLERSSARGGEARIVSIAELSADDMVVVVWTWRRDKRRIISVRRVRDGERRAYRQLHGG